MSAAAPPRVAALARARDLGMLLAVFPSACGDAERLYLFGRGLVVTGGEVEAAFAWRTTTVIRRDAGRAYTFTDREQPAVTILESERPYTERERAPGERTAGPFARTTMWMRAAQEGIANARP